MIKDFIELPCDGTTDGYVNALTSRIRELEAALREIAADYPKSGEECYHIANRALEEKK